MIPVILSGGSGTRLWPLSRKQFPKQYLPLLSDNTMLQETILRLSGLGDLSEPIIICNEAHRFVVAEQCQQINITNPTILLEPTGRNTAPAIAAAALQAQKISEDSILLVLSADHFIKNVNEFHKAIDIAFKQAQKGKLVTFGIVPTDANTGYGYIKSAINETGGAYQVEEFVEKPDAKTAKSYLEKGNYLWNSGMFMFQANTLVDELSEYSSNIVISVIDAVRKSKQDLDFIRLDEKSFKSSPSESIDCALMEKSSNVVVVSLDAQWSDVGSWPALYDIDEKDNNGNVIKGDVIAKDTKNTYINASHHMITTLGVENLIVVDTPDATFIATQDKAQEVKAIVESLKSDVRDEGELNRKVYRPWGWYDSIGHGSNFQVKRLHVNPGEKLSLQMHHKRSEHWVVVSGVATVTNGNQELTLTQGQSTYIPLKTVHCLENRTDESLEIIEIQSGEYLGEDDVVRFADIYGRVSESVNL
ncbi:MAG: mannose-1-phosphate guanylyltransferase/mannose-6-phosphate isomerase [Gammaproteobacteria bacterium]|nr:mannose-1-phosphate guanylyltransferase/mannose-6-phosphate isomerase [Gammaproteobacteria bacterium]